MLPSAYGWFPARFTLNINEYTAAVLNAWWLVFTLSRSSESLSLHNSRLTQDMNYKSIKPPTEISETMIFAVWSCFILHLSRNLYSWGYTLLFLWTMTKFQFKTCFEKLHETGDISDDQKGYVLSTIHKRQKKKGHYMEISLEVSTTYFGVCLAFRSDNCAKEIQNNNGV